MSERNVADIAAELQRQAEQKFGSERAEALRKDLLLMAQELHSLHTYSVDYEDEP